MTQGQVYPSMMLRTSNLVWGRGGMALSGAVNLELGAGRCLLLRGPNGTGKTTLLLTLLGLVASLDGHFEWTGGAEDERFIHFCGHRNAIKGRLTVEENLFFWARVNGQTGRSVDDALETVGLAHLYDLDAGFLSAGQGRRLALARLLVTNRPVWLLDEPTAALDAEGHALVGELIGEHLDRGGMAMVATHDPIPFGDASRVASLQMVSAA
jgi:heme exporter protein A